MKKILLISVILFTLLSCNHNIPIANLKFTKIEKDNKHDDYYNLYFSSDIELIENLKKSELGSARFNCFFDKIQFNNQSDYNKYLGYYLRASRDIKEVSKKKSMYNYVVEVTFDKKVKDNSSYFLNKKDISNILNLLNTGDKCLNCAITSVTVLSTTKRYVSNTMCLPKSEIKKVMKE